MSCEICDCIRVTAGAPHALTCPLRDAETGVRCPACDRPNAVHLGDLEELGGLILVKVTECARRGQHAFWTIRMVDATGHPNLSVDTCQARRS